MLIRWVDLISVASSECKLIPRHVGAAVGRQGMLVGNTLKAEWLLVKGFFEITSADGKEYAAVGRRRKGDWGQTRKHRKAHGALTARNCCMSTEMNGFYQ
jgi:hypothetical protein